MARSEPYTLRGIKRIPCIRCGKQGHAHWTICADKVEGSTRTRVLCIECDIGMNELAMRYVFGDTRETDLATYREGLMC